MGVIKNKKTLATTKLRRDAIAIVESGFAAIAPKEILKNNFTLQGTILHIQKEQFPLKKFKRIFLIGFGKGSAGISHFIEQTLGKYLTDGYDIDVIKQKFEKIHFTLGTHPLPSQENIDFTTNVLTKIKDLTEEDLVLVVICGGGSAMFEAPVKVTLDTLMSTSKALLRSGATITEMNVIRKHLSRVKGGGLAKLLYPANVVSLLFSDVPGNNLSVIASGPTVKDDTTLQQTKEIVAKYNLQTIVSSQDFTETPVEEKYFQKVTNILMVSNLTALTVMKQKAEDLGYKSRLYSDRLQGDAKQTGQRLIELTRQGEALFAGGETTVKVRGDGKGGRNQALVLASLAYIKDNTIVVSFDSDGIDFYHFAGALGDSDTIKKARVLHLNIQKYLDNDDATAFFEKVGDGILTGPLASNVSDVMFILRL